MYLCMPAVYKGQKLTSVSSPGTGVSDTYDHHANAGRQTQSFGRKASAPNHRAVTLFIFWEGVCHDTCVEIRGQLSGIGSLIPPCGSWD